MPKERKDKQVHPSTSYPGGVRFAVIQTGQLRSRHHQARTPRTVPDGQYQIHDTGTESLPSVDPGVHYDNFRVPPASQSSIPGDSGHTRPSEIPVHLQPPRHTGYEPHTQTRGLVPTAGSIVGPRARMQVDSYALQGFQGPWDVGSPPLDPHPPLEPVANELTMAHTSASPHAPHSSGPSPVSSSGISLSPSPHWPVLPIPGSNQMQPASGPRFGVRNEGFERADSSASGIQEGLLYFPANASLPDSGGNSMQPYDNSLCPTNAGHSTVFGDMTVDPRQLQDLHWVPIPTQGSRVRRKSNNARKHYDNRDGGHPHRSS